ncbi:UDP-N-acetylmuramate dehydrogenase [Candidatus Uabimicrobium sp. HlEnr_7]|uniref:UDP-N-acetylmuramate dehydrogenase n=1 Tax=Candidatus Uabimicrobium helgolandensis TaxID=3095367 RepID=UPI0035573B41
MNEQLKKYIDKWSLHNGILTSFDVDLRIFTYFGIGGKADVFFCPTNLLQVQKCIELCTIHHINPKILGKGSNLLITKSQIPIVIYTKELCSYTINKNTITAQSGVSLPIIVRKAISSGLSLEKLTGIPGTLGGAVYGNSGTKWNNQLYAIGDYVEEIVAVSFDDASITKLSRADLHFKYRKSNLQSRFIFEVKLRISQGTPHKLIDSWKKFARKKSTSQPYKYKSAGCIFRNPPHIEAWKLIRQAKLCEFSAGDIVISSQHANFIVNKGNGSAKEVLEVISNIQKRIYEEFGLHLVLEIQIW